MVWPLKLYRFLGGRVSYASLFCFVHSLGISQAAVHEQMKVEKKAMLKSNNLYIQVSHSERWTFLAAIRVVLQEHALRHLAEETPLR